MFLGRLGFGERVQSSCVTSGKLRPRLEPTLVFPPVKWSLGVLLQEESALSPAHVGSPFLPPLLLSTQQTPGRLWGRRACSSPRSEGPGRPGREICSVTAVRGKRSVRWLIRSHVCSLTLHIFIVSNSTHVKLGGRGELVLSRWCVGSVVPRLTFPRSLRHSPVLRPETPALLKAGFFARLPVLYRSVYTPGARSRPCFLTHSLGTSVRSHWG